MRVFKKAILFILTNLLVLSAMQFALAPPADYERRVDAFYEGDYDSVIIGTSYGKNLIPDYLTDGEKVCNLSRPRIPIVDFSYMLRQLHKKQGLKRVYYDISVPYWTGELGEINRINMMHILSGREQAEYFFKVLTKQNYNDFFFRYELETPSLKAIPKTVKTKLHNLFEEPELPRLYTDESKLRVGVEFDTIDFSPEDILPESLEAFHDMATFCKENDIELILYITAFPKERLVSENMDDVHDYFTELFARYDLPLYDLNYVKWEYFPRETEEYLDIDGHMQMPLAKRQTELLDKILNSEDPSQYFVTDYSEVLKVFEDPAT